MEVNANTTYFIERNYDEKTWTFGGSFDRFSPECFSDATADRKTIKFSEKEANCFNSLVDPEGYTGHIGIIPTIRGLRFITF